VRSALVLFLLASLLQAQEPKLSIVVVEGQDAINNIRQPIARDPVIEVHDQSGAPVEGASVTFFLPGQGPGGTFANGTNTLTTTTDRNGRAVARGIHFSHQTGKFEIRVAASYQGQTASTTITQTNVSGISTSGGGPSHKVWIILAIAAGAAVGGAIAATHGGSSSSSSTAPIVITPGTPTVGGPH
jgi:hypothetical protein